MRQRVLAISALTLCFPLFAAEFRNLDLLIQGKWRVDTIEINDEVMGAEPCDVFEYKDGYQTSPGIYPETVTVPYAIEGDSMVTMRDEKIKEVLRVIEITRNRKVVAVEIYHDGKRLDGEVIKMTLTRVEE